MRPTRCARPREGTPGERCDGPCRVDLSIIPVAAPSVHPTPPAEAPGGEPPRGEPGVPTLAATLAELTRTLERLVESLDRPPVQRLLARRDLAEILRASTTVVDRERAAGRLPRPDLLIAGRSPRWRPETIRDWLAEGGGR